MPTKSFETYHIEKLKNPEQARLYLEVALEEYEQDGDTIEFLRALKQVTDAQGGMTKLSKKTNLSRQNLYKIMSGDRRPRLETITRLLKGLGFRLSLDYLNH
ncbi:MAG: addiction module antidote protein [Alphaproteobacteria bacterium]